MAPTVIQEPAPAPAPGGLRAVLRNPGVRALIAASLVAAISAGTTGLLLILRVRDLGGSYAFAGLVSAAFLFGSAASAPLVGRAMDRFGQTRVLTVTTVLTAAALFALAALPERAPDWTLAALALAGGLLHPPVGACTRALLPDVVRDPGALHSAYALESSALEVSYIAGPLLIGGIVAPFSTRLALATSTTLLVVGTTWFATRPASRRWRPEPRDGRGPRVLLGALASPAVRVLLLTVLACGISFGAIEVAVTAFATHLDHRDLAGPLLATWGFGSLVGGLLSARAPAPARPDRRLMMVLATLAVGDLLLVLFADSWVLLGLLPLSGLAIAPALGVVNAMAGDTATPGTTIESFAWLGTGVSAGFAAGAALAGGAADLAGPSGAFGVALGAVAAALSAFALGRGHVAHRAGEPARIAATRSA